MGGDVQQVATEAGLEVPALGEAQGPPWFVTQPDRDKKHAQRACLTSSNVSTSKSGPYPPALWICQLPVWGTVDVERKQQTL